MKYNWELLAYYIRKPCKLCKLSPDLQELIHNLICQRKTLREIAGALAQRGVHATQRQLWTHKKHLRKLIEIIQQTEVDAAEVKLRTAKTQLEQLRLARTREELAQAAFNALRELAQGNAYERILQILQEDESNETH